MAKKETFTREEVIGLILKERKRGFDICMSSYNEKKKSQYRGFSESYIKEQRAMQEEARLLANAISGGTALDLKPWQEYFQDYLEKYLP